MKLAEKIEDKSAAIDILGLGYVGLPLGLAFAAQGYRVVGIDKSQERVGKLNQGVSYITDITDDQLKNEVSAGRFRAATDVRELETADVVCVCLPTPLKSTREPDLSYITAGAGDIAGHLRSQQLIVLESTTYPGTTREIVLPILKSSGLKPGRDFYLAYSPERVDPGNRKFGIGNTPKLIGGIDATSAKLASTLYQQITEQVITLSSAEAAEMTKLFENVFRSVNIALVNELAQLCSRMGISVWEVIDAAKTKPFGFMAFQPGPGTGGHCIPLDPYYLASRAREYDFHTRFIELAAEVNEEMPYYIASQVMDALDKLGQSLKTAKVLLLGVTYKKDVADARESPSLKLLQLLSEKCPNIAYHDPYIAEVKAGNRTLKSMPLEKALAKADGVVIATDHSCFDISKIVAESKLVVDCRGVTRGISKPNITRIGE